MIYSLGKEEAGIKGTLRLDIKKKLNDQRGEDAFCDAILQVNGERTSAHRCVLGAATPYFYTMFFGEFKEKREQVVDMSPVFNSMTTLNSIIDFIYGGELTVTEDTVSDFLRGADVLMITEITELCLKFMLKTLNLQNCLWILSLADLYSLEDLKGICFDLAKTRFHDCLIGTEDALRLPPDYLKNHFGKGMADHCSENELSAFLEKYLNFDHEKRDTKMGEIKEAAVKSKLQASSQITWEKDGSAKNIEKWDMLPFHGASIDTGDILDESEEEREIDKGHENTETEILMFNITSKNYMLYSRDTSKWYELLTLDNTSSFSVLRAFTVAAIGIGEEGEFVLLISDESMTLMNIFTKEKYSMPPLPRKKKEAMIGNVQRGKVQYFCSQSQLYCLYECRLSETSVLMNTDMHNFHTNKTVHALYLQRFDLVKWKWKFVIVVEENQQSNMDVKILLHGEEAVYIFIIRKHSITLFKFDSLTQNLIPLQSMARLIRSQSVWVSGSRSALTVSSAESSKMFVYNIKRNTWSTCSNSSVPGESLVWSNTRNECYFISTGAVESIVHLKMMDISSGCVTQLPSVPELTLGCSIVPLRVHKSLLKKLPMRTNVSKMPSQLVCKQKEVDDIITKFKRKRYPDQDKQEDEDKNRSLKVNLFREAQQAALIRYMLGGDGLFDSWEMHYADDDDDDDDYDYYYHDDYDPYDSDY